MNFMNDAIRESEYAMKSVVNVCNKAGLNVANMDSDQLIDASRKICSPCKHKYSGVQKECVYCGAYK